MPSAEPQLKPRPAGHYAGYCASVPLLLHEMDTSEQLIGRSGEDKVLLSHEARLRTPTQSMSSRTGTVVGGPVWFGLNRRLQCVTQVCLPEPEADAIQPLSVLSL